jgi:hypothetical protein
VRVRHRRLFRQRVRPLRLGQEEEEK